MVVSRSFVWVLPRRFCFVRHPQDGTIAVSLHWIAGLAPILEIHFVLAGSLNTLHNSRLPLVQLDARCSVDKNNRFCGFRRKLDEAALRSCTFAPATPCSKKKFSGGCIFTHVRVRFFFTRVIRLSCKCHRPLRSFVHSIGWQLLFVNSTAILRGRISSTTAVPSFHFGIHDTRRHQRLSCCNMTSREGRTRTQLEVGLLDLASRYCFERAPKGPRAVVWCGNSHSPSLCRLEGMWARQQLLRHHALQEGFFCTT